MEDMLSFNLDSDLHVPLPDLSIGNVKILYYKKWRIKNNHHEKRFQN
jgi:hypothetical protein